MVRMFLYVLAWPVGLVVLLTVHGWIQEEFPDPPAAPETSGDVIRFPIAHRQALDAIARFERLTPAEQQHIAERLRASIQPLDAWFERLHRADYQVVCAGEFHAPATRRFIAERLLPAYAPDVLLLEATPGRLEWIEARTAAGRGYVPLLGADAAALLRAARAARPEVRIRGIEETLQQVRAREGREGSRDRSLARNFWSVFEPGARHLVLYGALHCTDEPGWLYRLLQVQSPPREALRMLSVQVIGAHQHGPTEAFVTFVDHLGIAAGDFAIPDTGQVPPIVRRWFGLLTQQVLARMDAMVVFRQRGVPTPPREREAPDPGDLPQWQPAAGGRSSAGPMPG